MKSIEEIINDWEIEAEVSSGLAVFANVVVLCPDLARILFDDFLILQKEEGQSEPELEKGILNMVKTIEDNNCNVLKAATSLVESSNKLNQRAGYALLWALEHLEG